MRFADWKHYLSLVTWWNYPKILLGGGPSAVSKTFRGLIVSSLSSMMTSNLSGHIDARRSHFHNVGHDQNNVYQTIHITIADLTPAQICPPAQNKRLRNRVDNDDRDDVSRTRHKRRKFSPTALPHILNEVSQKPSLSAQTSSQIRVVAHAYCPEIGFAGDVTTSLIVKIVQSLVDRGEARDDYRILELELDSLRQTLTLTGLAIQAYENTPLARNLANSINPEVAQMRVLLQELFEKINNYQQGLKPTFIGAIWDQVWRSRRVDGLASLRMRLSGYQRLLCGFLAALNS